MTCCSTHRGVPYAGSGLTTIIKGARVGVVAIKTFRLWRVFAESGAAVTDPIFLTGTCKNTGYRILPKARAAETTIKLRTSVAVITGRALCNFRVGALPC